MYMFCCLLACYIGRFHLVFWENENSVSVVSAANVLDGNEPAVGETAVVVIGQHRYPGLISATGTAWACMYSVLVLY